MNSSFGEMLDTSPAARERYYAALRAMTPAERGAHTSHLTRMIRAAAAAGVRARNPRATSDEVERRIAELIYGEDVVARVLKAK